VIISLRFARCQHEQLQTARTCLLPDLAADWAAADAADQSAVGDKLLLH